MADLLLSKGYRVYGVVRRTSTGSDRNIRHLRREMEEGSLRLIGGDVTDAGSLHWVVKIVTEDRDGTEGGTPVEVYHFADQDHVGSSFETPVVSVETTYGGTVNLLEVLRRGWLDKGGQRLQLKIFQPASATMFGPGAPIPQTFHTPLNPQSPYAVAKVAAYHAARYYRDTHGMRVYTAILFNHDSPRRNRNYLLQKIVTEGVRMMREGDDVFHWSGGLHDLVTVAHAKDVVDSIHEYVSRDSLQTQMFGSSELTTPHRLIEYACGELGRSLDSYKIQTTEGRHRPGKHETLVGDFRNGVGLSSPSGRRYRTVSSTVAEIVAVRLKEENPDA